MLQLFPRSDFERRSGFDRRLLSQDEREAMRCCQIAARVLNREIRFQGIQEGFGNIPPLCLFAVGGIRTTMCVPMPATVPSIIERIAPAPAVIAPAPSGFAGIWHRLGIANAPSNRAEKSA